MTGAGALAVLSRVRAARADTPEQPRCEMCAAPVGEDHRHVVDLSRRALLCTCRACALLFDDPAAQLGYRAVPDRFLALPDLPGPLWDALELPVGTAFLLRSSAPDRVVALYPGPAGATESSLELTGWEQLLAAVPALGTLRADVEALLVRAHGTRVEAFVVPVDVCYELVGVLRQLWRGFDGGQEVRARLDAFFAGVRHRARPA